MTGTTLEERDLAPGTRYRYAVRGVRGSEAPVWSSVVRVKTEEFEAPGSFRVAAIGTNRLRARWTKRTESGVEYVVRYRAKGKRKWEEVRASKSPRAIPGLSADTEYELRLHAERISGGKLRKSAFTEATARTRKATE